MIKKIFILNGTGGSGKDTFAECLNKIIPTQHISIVDKAKLIAKKIGWKGEKTEKDRKFLSDIKLAIDNYDDSNFEYIKNAVEVFKQDKEHNILCIDMRERNQIARAKKEFGAQTILIERDQVKNILSNPGDADVYNTVYDYTIDNSGSLDDLQGIAQEFINEYVINEKKTDYKNKIKDSSASNKAESYFNVIDFINKLFE